MTKKKKQVEEQPKELLLPVEEERKANLVTGTGEKIKQVIPPWSPIDKTGLSPEAKRQLKNQKTDPPSKDQWQNNTEQAKEVIANSLKEIEEERETIKIADGTGEIVREIPKEKPQKPEEQLTWQEDERFKHPEKDKPSKKMKREMEKELAKEKRINLAAKAKHFMSGGLDVQGWTIIKVIRSISMAFGWLLNLFTVAVMIYLVVDVIVLFKFSSINNYYMVAKVVLEMVFLWMIVKIHEKIEV